MKRLTIKRVSTVGLTFAVALGTGFVVQYGDAVASKWGVEKPVAGPGGTTSIDDQVIIPVAATVTRPATITAPAMITPQSVALDGTDFPMEETVPTFLPAPTRLVETVVEDAPILEEEALLEEEVVDCSVSMSATALPMAMVELTVMAPCNADQPFAIHHNAMMFNDMTDENGETTVVVPALTEDAFFIAAFDGGVGAIAQTAVEDMASYDRFVLQWQGDMGVELHAMEFGATYGTEGHRWSQAVGASDAVMAGQSGMVTLIGNAEVLNAMRAEVYTYPRDVARQSSEIALSVEAAITDANCGQTIYAQTIWTDPLGELATSDMSMPMPACDATGDYLVLNIQQEDLTLASK